jgi:hypothetical protein
MAVAVGFSPISTTCWTRSSACISRSRSLIR